MNKPGLDDERGGLGEGAKPPAPDKTVTNVQDDEVMGT